MKKLIYLSIATFMITSCGSLVENLNEDPNNPTTAPYQNILTGAEVGNIILQTGETARRAGIFSGYYTGIDRQHEGFNSYTVTTSDFDNLWDDAFVNTIRNARVTEEKALEQGISGITIGITQLIQAMAFGTTTSLFGDIPFEEAGSFEFENPAFENQAGVYTKIQSLLDEAITNLQSGGGRPASGSDIYFNGDPAAWIEVANTLKARYYVHTGEFDKAYASALNGISSLENSLYGPHGTGSDASNLSYQFFAIQSRGADLVVSDFIASLVDPEPATNPEPAAYRGNSKTNEAGRYNYYFDITSVGIQPNTGPDGWAAETAPACLVTYEENLLILTEAGFRTGGFATGLTRLNEFRNFMNNGGYITDPDLANIRYDAYTANDFNSGGIENMDGISADNALLREILEERYVTFFGQIEGFNDTRRTENELVVRVPVKPNAGSQLPERFIYPQSEIDRNSNIPDPIPGLFEATPVNQ